jgi:hypothetical protein
LVHRLEEIDVVELAQVITMWTHKLGFGANRRELLSKLSAAATLAAAAPVDGILDPEERERVTRVVQGVVGFTEPALRYCEVMAGTLGQQVQALGPRLGLQNTLGHRDVAHRLAHSAPPELRQRALSVYAELTQLAGWMCFSLGDCRGAEHYYEDARSAAHDAQNIDLLAYILSDMSYLATGKASRGSSLTTRSSRNRGPRRPTIRELKGVPPTRRRARLRPTSGRMPAESSWTSRRPRWPGSRMTLTTPGGTTFLTKQLSGGG